MIFHSVDFLLFFVLVVGVYWMLPHHPRQVWLLLSSYFFYGYIHPWFLYLLVASTTVDYWSARLMEDDPGRRKLYLALTLTANLGLLGFCKYFNFFVDNVYAALDAAGWRVDKPVLTIVLPVGISFYTFQTLTYTIDVYRGLLAARRRFVDVALFVAFFPQLVAGPIERAKSLLPQVETPRFFDWDHARRGLMLMVWGFFQKLVVADNVGVVANKVFSIREPGFWVLWAGVVAFGIQIYADFAAYSNIARGSARWFGFELMRNFNHPYLARNPVDLWRRWHISLSSWFRDYVYIPLGGNRSGPATEVRNTLLTFGLSGVWHGASWNFLLWGLYHGALVVLWRRFEPYARASFWQGRVAAVIQTLTMYVLTTVGWLFFRETDSAYLWRALQLSPFGSTPLQRQIALYLLTTTVLYALPLFAEAAVAPWWDAVVEASSPVSTDARHDAAVHPRWTGVALQAALAGLLVSGILIFRSRTSLDFIYFQF